MKRVLVLAYNFPPMGGGGVQRVAKFVKYLPDFGWEPVVLTADDRLYWARDETLLEDIPPRIVIRRLSPKSPHLFYAALAKLTSPKTARKILDNIFVPDDRVFWALSAALWAVPMLKKEGISLVYSTSPPHSTHIAGLILKGISGLPWVADFRDPWTTDFGYDPATSWVRRAHASCERRILTRADRVICITESVRKRYISDFGIDTGRLVTIYNGFDAQDFSDTPQKGRNISDRVLITHSGSLYGAYFPETFFHALARALEADRDLKERLVVRFVGVMDQRIREKIGEILPDNTVFTGYVSHKEALDAIRESDINLIARPLRKELSYNVSGKLFEYLAAKRPILAVVPRGEIARIVRSARAGIVINEDDEEALSVRLVSAIKELKEWDDPSVDEGVVSGFERRRLTERLSHVFDEAAGE